jgi:hypothetical protein
MHMTHGLRRQGLLVLDYRCVVGGPRRLDGDLVLMISDKIY